MARRTRPVWMRWSAPWEPSRAIYHLWGSPQKAKCGRPLKPLTLGLPLWIADTFARPCKRCDTA